MEGVRGKVLESLRAFSSDYKEYIYAVLRANKYLLIERLWILPSVRVINKFNAFNYSTRFDRLTNQVMNSGPEILVLHYN